jgi:hypothetical protein
MMFLTVLVVDPSPISRNNKLVVLSSRVDLMPLVRTAILMGWTKESQVAAEVVLSRKS